MLEGTRRVLLGVCVLCLSQVVSAEDNNTAIIAASTVVGVLVVVLVVGITCYCFYRKQRPSSFHRSKKVPVYNGGPPPYYHDDLNGYVPKRPGMYAHQTYSGPPPATLIPPPPQQAYHSMRGPPTTPVVVIPTSHGSIALRPDPRPVIHHSHKKHTRNGDAGRYKKHSSRPKQEYIVQRSYDGVPVIRPIIYVDDDEPRHRSKSRDRKSRRSRGTPSPAGARISEVDPDSTEAKQQRTEEAEVHLSSTKYQSRSRSRSRSPARSQTSSVHEAVSAIQQSLVDPKPSHHGRRQSSSSSSVASLPTTRHSTKGPDPVAGDVMFFPAGTEAPSLRQTAPATLDPDYSYARVVKDYSRVETETRDDPTSVTRETLRTSVVEQGRSSPKPSPTRQSQRTTTFLDQGRSSPVEAAERTDTRDYETEHSRVKQTYSDLRTTVSDRMASMVEDGDRERKQHYNVEALSKTTGADGEREAERNYSTDATRLSKTVYTGDRDRHLYYNADASRLSRTTTDRVSYTEKVEMRVKRPQTPPSDIPRSSRSERESYRPPTPPNDIPAVTPRESTEIPKLEFPSSFNTPRDLGYSARTASPPRDFPTTPLSQQRPPTPPMDVESARDAVNPVTGEVGSFQARKHMIEAHFLRNFGPGTGGGVPSNKTSSAVQFTNRDEYIPRSEHSSPRHAADYYGVPPTMAPPPPVNLEPGVIPIPPPPPPVPPPPPIGGVKR